MVALSKNNAQQKLKAMATLKVLITHRAEKGYVPNYSELGRLLGISSNAASKRVECVVKEYPHVIKLRYGTHRPIQLL